MTAASATIVDPAGGRQRLTRDEFDDQFTGVAIRITKASDDAPADDLILPGRGAWLRYGARVWRDPGALANAWQMIAAAVLVQLMSLAPPLLSRFVVDVVMGLRLTDVVALGMIGTALVVGTQFFAGLLRGRATTYLRTAADAHLMRAFVAHLLALPATFFSARSTGDLLTRLTSNTIIRETMTTQALLVILEAPLVVAVCAALALQDVTACLIAVGFAAIQVLVMVAGYPKMSQLTGKYVAGQAQEQSCLVELVRGVTTVKASGAESVVLERWGRLFNMQAQLAADRAILSSTIDGLIGLTRATAPLLVMWWGVHQVLAGELTVGTVVALAALTGMLIGPVGTLVNSLQQLQLATISLSRVLDVLDAPVEETAGLPCTALAPRLRVSGLGFRYPGQRADALDDISFSVEPGEKLAIVGASGSGKSTLMHLLLGLLQPSRGEVQFGGRDIVTLDRRELRRRCGVVFQEPVLFHGSVWDNVALAFPQATERDVTLAAQVAGLGELLQSPMGLHLPIGEGGRNISGGQRQRIAIARAVVHRPAWLFLDEATSHLDPPTEALVEHALRGLGCTRVVIAHRLSTIVDADTIVVLDGGRVVDQGRHEELLGRCAAYRALARLVHQPGALVATNG